MIFCVEDDSNIRELIIYTLNSTGMEAKGFDNSTALMKALVSETPELILLDIMLPGEDGISILKKLKASVKTKQIPVIMVTAKGAEYDVVKGLDTGADDYVTKPFGMMELVSRIKAVLRRSAPNQTGNVYEVGGLLVDEEKREVHVDGENVILTLKEFELLRRILKSGKNVITRERLLEEVWGYDFIGESRTLDVHMRTLRQKLGKAGEMIQTVRGVGYRLGGSNEN